MEKCTCPNAQPWMIVCPLRERERESWIQGFELKSFLETPLLSKVTSLRSFHKIMLHRKYSVTDEGFSFSPKISKSEGGQISSSEKSFPKHVAVFRNFWALQSILFFQCMHVMSLDNLPTLPFVLNNDSHNVCEGLKISTEGC